MFFVLLVAVGFVFLVLGSFILVDSGYASRLEANGINGNVMFTMHQTQIDHTLPDYSTKFWAMFVPAVTESPSHVSSPGRLLVKRDMCLEEDGADCSVGPTKFNFESCMKDNNRLSFKCRGESAHKLMLETNDRSSVGITGSTQARTLLATIFFVTGIAFVMIGCSIFVKSSDDSSVSGGVETEAQQPQPAGGYCTDCAPLISVFEYKFIVLLTWVVAVFFCYVVVDNEKEDKYELKYPNSTLKQTIKVTWAKIDNAILYCVLFIVVFTMWMANTAIPFVAFYKSRQSPKSSAPSLDQKLSLVNSRSAVDMAIAFLFQILVWYEVVNSHRSILDTALQNYLLAAAGISVTFLLNNELVTAMCSLNVFNPEVRRTTSFLASLFCAATLVIMVTLFQGVFSADLLVMPDLTHYYISTWFWLFMIAPVSLLFLSFVWRFFNSPKSENTSEMADYGYYTLYPLFDGLKIVLFGVFVCIGVAMRSGLNTDVGGYQYHTALLNRCSLNEVDDTDCNFLKLRANLWIRDATSFSNVNHADKNSKIDFCRLGMFPEYKCW